MLRSQKSLEFEISQFYTTCVKLQTKGRQFKSISNSVIQYIVKVLGSSVYLYI